MTGMRSCETAVTGERPFSSAIELVRRDIEALGPTCEHGLVGDEIRHVAPADEGEGHAVDVTVR